MSKEFRIRGAGEQWFFDGVPESQTFQFFNAVNDLLSILNAGAVPNAIFEDLDDINNKLRQPEEGWTVWVENQVNPIEQAIYYNGVWVRALDGTTPIV